MYCHGFGGLNGLVSVTVDLVRVEVDRIAVDFTSSLVVSGGRPSFLLRDRDS